MTKPRTNSTAIPSRERVRKHRELLRNSGLRPVTHWVPNVKDPAFIKRYRAQIATLITSEAVDPELSNWIDQVQCTEGWV